MMSYHNYLRVCECLNTSHLVIYSCIEENKLSYVFFVYTSLQSIGDLVSFLLLSVFSTFQFDPWRKLCESFNLVGCSSFPLAPRGKEKKKKRREKFKNREILTIGLRKLGKILGLLFFQAQVY